MLRSTNVDFLRWFSDDEREACGSCGVRAAVSFPEVAARFCLACAAVWMHGERLDADGVIAVEAGEAAVAAHRQQQNPRQR